MVFQLITFFMLVINFKSAEIGLELETAGGGIGPAGRHPRPARLAGPEHRQDRQPEDSTGGPIENVEGYIASEAVRRQMSARMTAADLEAGQELPTTVVIRADRATAFKMIYRVIKACQDNGFRSSSR